MALTTRVWSAGKILMLVAGLAATFVLFFAASVRFALKAREVQVPNLTNRTANEATAIAGDLGLTLRVDDTRRQRLAERLEQPVHHVHVVHHAP